MGDLCTEPWGDNTEDVGVTILGCGKLGTAVLIGLLSCDTHSTVPSIRSITVTVRTSDGKDRVIRELVEHFGADWISRSTETQVTVLLHEQNAYAVSTADIVILGCKPFGYQKILTDPDTQDALIDGQKKRLLVSMLGGVSICDIQQQLYGLDGHRQEKAEISRCVIARAIPNIAARIRESVTVISVQSTDFNVDHQTVRKIEQTLVRLFDRVGRTEIVAEESMNAATSLSASALAFFANLIAAAASGAQLHSPLETRQAIRISAYAACGGAKLMISGLDANTIEQLVATEGGSTMRGLDIMHANQVDSSVQEAVAATIHAVKGLSSPQSGGANA